MYGIPRATLFDKVKERTPLTCTLGAPTVLTKEEENQLANWVINMGKIGYGRTRQELTLTVKQILDKTNRRNPFKNNLPGRHWVEGFLQRHQHISKRTKEALGKERACVTSAKLDKWFNEFETYIKDIESQGDIFDNPMRIFNADESGFALAGKSEKVLALKVHKSQITCLACCNAGGMYLPPMLIFPGVRFKYNPLDGAPAGSCLGRSENGWINSEIFYEWVANHFHTFLVKEKIQLPVILLIDGHSSHINLDTATFCSENGIILYCLPPHASHVIQPLDVSVFKALKTKWNQEVRYFQITHPGENVTKQTFASVFGRAWPKAITPENAINGFKSCGIFPLDKTAIDQKKLLPSTVFASTEPALLSAPDSRGM
ncbi:Jerky protein-like-like [Holothuria leucospilota]|uniref:Jerky protein-like-like n=1 Tax=Holothuria leucospilota TaxID=206669 RepID=A0A9Q1HBW3_HOLLE|nr:Jerky protein-like-like [Holothuria leucospilota]